MSEFRMTPEEIRELFSKPTITPDELLRSGVLPLTRSGIYEAIKRQEIKVLEFGRKKAILTAPLRAQLGIGGAVSNDEFNADLKRNHRSCMQKVLKCVGELSRALADEEAARAAFPANASPPNLCAGLSHCRLDDPNSLSSDRAKKLRKAREED